MRNDISMLIAMAAASGIAVSADAIPQRRDELPHMGDIRWPAPRNCGRNTPRATPMTDDERRRARNKAKAAKKSRAKNRSRK